MFTAVRLGKTDFGQLSSSLSQVTPIAAAMGIGFEDVTAGLASITAQGTPTAQAATGLRAMFTELGDSGSEVGGIFEDVAGVSFLDFIEQGGNTAEVLQLLEQEAIDSGVPLQDMFGSIKAGVSALQLTGAGMEGFEANLEEMANSAGATETAYDTMNEGLARGFEVMKATVATIMIDVGKAIGPVVEWLSGKLLKAFENLQPYIDFVVQEFGDFFDALANGENPLAAITDLADNLLRLFGASDEDIDSFRQAVDDVVAAFETGKQMFADVKDRLTELLAPVMEAATQFVNWKDILITLGLAIASFVLPIIAGIITTLAPIIAVVLLVIGIVALLRNAWENDWGGIRTKLIEVWEGTIKPAFETLKEWLEINIPIAIETLKGFWENTLLPAITKVWDFIANTLVPIFVEIVSTVFENVKEGISTLSDFWTNTLLPAIQDVWAFIQDDLMPLFNVIVDFMNAAFTLALTALQGIWENVLLPALTKIWEFIQDNLLPIIKDLVEKGLEVAKGVVEDLTIVWETLLLPALEAIWGFIQDNILPIFQDLIDKIVDKLQPVIVTITEVFDKVTKAVENISWAIDSLIGWFNDLIKKIQDFELPWWMTPGSPTPLETGLIGVAKAARLVSNEMKAMDGSGILGSTINLGVNKGLSGGFSYSNSPGFDFDNGSGNRGAITEYHLHINRTEEPDRVITDFGLLEALA